MRDPNRIDGILERLGKAWKQVPDMRLAQLIGCTEIRGHALYCAEDERILAAIESVIRDNQYIRGDSE